MAKKKKAKKRKRLPEGMNVSVTDEIIMIVIRQRAQSDQRVADLLTSVTWEGAALSLNIEKEELRLKLLEIAEAEEAAEEAELETETEEEDDDDSPEISGDDLEADTE